MTRWQPDFDTTVIYHDVPEALINVNELQGANSILYSFG